LLCRLLPVRTFFEERSGSPKFPGDPRDHAPCSSTPARPSPRYGTSCQRTRQGPRIKPQRRLSTLANFGAQSHGIWPGCLRFAVEVTRHHARLASGHWPPATGRDSNPQSPDERFPNGEILPPFLSFLAQGSFCRFRGGRRAIYCTFIPILGFVCSLSHPPNISPVGGSARDSPQTNESIYAGFHA
jgi:hypothetical protein